MSMSGKMSTGIRTSVTAPMMTISIDITTNVYGRFSAMRTSHMSRRHLRQHQPHHLLRELRVERSPLRQQPVPVRAEHHVDEELDVDRARELAALHRPRQHLAQRLPPQEQELLSKRLREP